MRATAFILAAAVMLAGSTAAFADPDRWKREWPTTDFSKTSVAWSEIMSGGPPKDGIPSIDEPEFVAVAEDDDLAPTEPVIGLDIGGEAKAYPLRILMWHEIVNDTIGGVPVTVTYCPLCNSAIVFDRRLGGKVLDFGTTGKLRNSDLVMYDRQTESWWQQFLGEGIVGEMMGKQLKMLPSRMESFANYKARFPEGKVLVPNNSLMRRYGSNPYEYYDSAQRPFLYRGDMPDGVPPMMRVVVVDKQAWTLPMIRNAGTLKAGDLTISWTKGQNSALDAAKIAKGRDVGNVVVTRGGKDELHHVTFAFVFHAFHPDGVIHKG